MSFFIATSLFLCVKLLVFYKYIFTHQSLLETVARSKHVDDSPCSAFCTFRTPCLHRLITPNEKTKTSRKLPNANYLQQPDSIQEINRIPGSLDPVHYHIVPVISAVQWHNGVYGSVAEFGVGVGKFTSLLARSVDAAAGERLFVADDFSRPLDGQLLSMRGRLTQYDLFAANLRRVGFDETATGPRRMLVHRGTAESFQFVRLKEWRLPLFRLISVDFRALNVTTRSPVLDLAACLLTDGGILVVGGIDELSSSSTRQLLQGVSYSVLTTFLLKSEGKPELSPVFVAGDKLFITNSRWSQSLRSHVIEAAENLHLRVTEDDVGFDFATKLLRIKY